MRSLLGLGALLVVACGSGNAIDEDGPDDGHPASSSSSGAPDTSSAGSAAASSSSGAAAEATLTELGVWAVRGTDARGVFQGEIELLRAADDSLHFARTVRYAGVTVEDGKELHLAWTGTLADLESDAVTLAGALDPRGFIRHRGDTVHALTDAVTPTMAHAVRHGATVDTTWTVGDATFDETWSDHRASGVTPVFVNLRTQSPADPPPSSTTKSTLFATYSEFQAQPLMVPYVDRADFQAAIFENVLDTTDADFYRAHPSALRVVDRPVDPISLLEAERRRSAYAPTLEAKAALLDADMVTTFLDDGVWFSPDSIVDGASGPVNAPSGDGSLWTGSYVVSQVQRYKVTGAADALLNVERSVDSMAKLQEITGDDTQFARALRKAEAEEGNGWHHGVGQYAALDWLEGVNNDMFSGLMLTFVFAYPLLCEGTLAASHGALCTRLENDIDHLSDLAVASGSGNKLDAYWLKSIVNPTDLGARSEAEAAWVQEKTGNRFFAVNYTYGIGCDWSGTNLTFAGILAESVMARRLELGGDAIAELGSFIDRSQDSVKDQRLATWNLMRAMYGATPPDAAYVEDTKWRLREMPAPKIGVAIDHTVSPEFSLAPYPSQPWKNDWSTPGNRLQSLYNYPLFEGPADVFVWRLGLTAFSDNSGRKAPGTDYLYLYWLAREKGILAAGE